MSFSSIAYFYKIFVNFIFFISFIFLYFFISHFIFLLIKTALHLSLAQTQKTYTPGAQTTKLYIEDNFFL